MRSRSRSQRTTRYAIRSWGNALFYELRRVGDGATVFLQGEDARRFDEELDKTNRRFTDADVAALYFDTEPANSA